MRKRPSEAIFADGRNRVKPLALLPAAVGVMYDTYDEAACGAQLVNGVAILPVDGPLCHKPGWWQDYESLAIAFQDLCNDARVNCILLKFDSPGGDVAGLNETVKQLEFMKARGNKRVVGYVDEACYSAAYAIATVCDEIYLPESGGLGSIGVITAMADCTAMDKAAGLRIEVIASGTKKTDGHPHVAMTDEAIERTRATVDKLAASFFELVADARGLTSETVDGFEAGIFTGQAAVDAGLADGVMSLQDCLTLATEQYSKVIDPPVSKAEKEETMSGQLAAAKALKDANAKLTSAKTDAERALAAARVLAAEETLAKVKKTKTVTTDTHEEEIDDGEPEEAELPADDEDEDEEEEAAASASIGRTTKGDDGGLLALCKKITGHSTLEEVMGALHAMTIGSKKSASLAAEVAKLKADAEASKVSAMIASGMKAGKLAPSQRAWAKTQTSAGLKAYLDAAPKMVGTISDEHAEAPVVGVGFGAVSAEMAKIWKKQGFKEADFPKLLEKLNGAKSVNGAS